MGRDSDLRSVRVSPRLRKEEDDDDCWRGGGSCIIEACVPIDIDHTFLSILLSRLSDKDY